MSLTTPFPEQAIWSRSRRADIVPTHWRVVCYATCECALGSFEDLRMQEEEEEEEDGGVGREAATTFRWQAAVKATRQNEGGEGRAAQALKMG